MKITALALAAVYTAGLLGLTGCEPSGSGAAAGAPPAVGHLQGPLPGTAPPPPQRRNPYRGDRVAIREGRNLFVDYNCYGCHGGRAGGGMGPSLRDRVWIHGSTDADIFASIAEGRPNGMPAWGLSLPSDQIWKLTAYITSLRTELEPEKPR